MNKMEETKPCHCGNAFIETVQNGCLYFCLCRKCGASGMFSTDKDESRMYWNKKIEARA